MSTRCWTKGKRSRLVATRMNELQHELELEEESHSQAAETGANNSNAHRCRLHTFAL